MNASLLDKLLEAHRLPKSLPGVGEAERFIDRLLQLLFPELSNDRLGSVEAIETHLRVLRLEFEGLLYRTGACKDTQVGGICREFFDRLESVYDLCVADGEAILAGDPAAVDTKEVIRTYPGFFAIAVYRIAHLVHQLDVPYLPRILTEYAHSRTGIDIHPAARIGRRFCIDHGTGIVVGETTIIGDDVKLYQGVTLGALSVSKAMAKEKRHPTIEDGVVIYAEATILGGSTVIGRDSVIGGNVWITESVPPNSKVYYSQKSHQEVKSR
jgi:serine O-acetyltransferase